MFSFPCFLSCVFSCVFVFVWVFLSSVCVFYCKCQVLLHLHRFDLCKIARIVYEHQEILCCFHISFLVFSSLTPIVGIVFSLQGDQLSS